MMGARAIVESPDPIEALIRAGSYREATTLCLKLHGAAIGRLCMALIGSQGEAEEALQDTLIAAHDGMAQYRGDGSVRAWLFGIARRTCARRLLRRVERENKLRLLPDRDPAASPDEIFQIKKRAEKIRSALEALPPTERETLVLRYSAELSFREIGQACDIDEATARKRASRALERLRTLFANMREDVLP